MEAPPPLVSLLPLIGALAGCHREPTAGPMPTHRLVTSSDARLHDFGVILGNRGTLSHRFQVENGGDHDLRLTGALAMSPCCSSIGPLPQGPIRPGAVASVPVTFRTGGESGNRRLEFFIQTDSPNTPTIPLILTAACFDDWDITPVEGGRFTLKPGQAGRRTYEVISRRRDVEGTLPRLVNFDPAIRPVLDQGGLEKITAQGFVEVARRLVVYLPAMTGPGLKRAQVGVEAGNAGVRTFDVELSVTPCLTAVPSGLVIERGAGPAARTIVLRSDERPFRLVGMSGPHLAGGVALPTKSAIQHRIDLRFEVGGARDREAFTVAIETDHPDQPVVNVGVLVL